MIASLNKSPSSGSDILNYSGFKTVSNFGAIILLSGQSLCDEIVLLYCLLVQEDHRARPLSRGSC